MARGRLSLGYHRSVDLLRNLQCHVDPFKVYHATTIIIILIRVKYCGLLSPMHAS